MGQPETQMIVVSSRSGLLVVSLSLSRCFVDAVDCLTESGELERAKITSRHCQQLPDSKEL